MKDLTCLFEEQKDDQNKKQSFLFTFKNIKCKITTLQSQMIVAQFLSPRMPLDFIWALGKLKENMIDGHIPEFCFSTWVPEIRIKLVAERLSGRCRGDSWYFHHIPFWQSFCENAYNMVSIFQKCILAPRVQGPQLECMHSWLLSSRMLESGPLKEMQGLQSWSKGNQHLLYVTLHIHHSTSSLNVRFRNAFFIIKPNY